MKFVTRKEWGARSPRSQASYLASTRGVKVHYMGSYVDPRIEKDHDRCAALARQVQNGHMDGNGWQDVGYSLLVCPHRYVFEGRGVHRLPAANGQGLNTGHYAVLGMVGNAGLTEPSDDMLHGIRDAIEYLREKGDAGSEIKGHRDGFATDCPGTKLYAWVKDGAPRPKTTTIEEDDVAAVDVWKHEIRAPWVESGDDMWEAGTHLRVMHSHIRSLEAQVEALAADNKVLREGQAEILSLLKGSVEQSGS